MLTCILQFLASIPDCTSDSSGGREPVKKKKKKIYIYIYTHTPGFTLAQMKQNLWCCLWTDVCNTVHSKCHKVSFLITALTVTVCGFSGDGKEKNCKDLEKEWKKHVARSFV